MNTTKYIVILGAGESGVGAAKLAQHLGMRVFVSDFGKIKEEFKQELINNKIEFEEEKHTEEKILNADEVIKSPGIPDKAPIIKKLKEKNIPVISEIEMAARYTDAKLIAITGSNGKTTTTLLTYHLLKNAGINVGLAGNIGYSFAAQVIENKFDYYVLELSSFQLDGIKEFRADIAILLNITPDHLDRYEYKLENYIQSKFRIGMNQKDDDIFIHNSKDENIISYLKNKEINHPTIQVDDSNQSGSHLKVGGYTFDMQTCSLKGEHNMFNATCAILAAQSVGIKNEDIQQGLETFVNVPHRLEVVAEINGVQYINDSKATNVDATYYALKAMTRPVIWIAGGTDKGNDYTPIFPWAEKNVKALICMGVDNSKLLEGFNPIIKNIEETSSAKEAVERAGIYAEPGDVVLLSPCCASFDLFNNYEHRGNLFKEAVSQLLKETTSPPMEGLGEANI